MNGVEDIEFSSPRPGGSDRGFIEGKCGTGGAIADAIREDPQGTGRIVYLLANLQETRIAFLEAVLVHDEFRGQGIGRTLVQRFIRVARNRGAAGIFLVADDHGPSEDEGDEDEGESMAGGVDSPVAFFEKLGFTVVDGEDRDRTPVMYLAISRSDAS